MQVLQLSLPIRYVRPKPRDLASIEAHERAHRFVISLRPMGNQRHRYRKSMVDELGPDFGDLLGFNGGNRLPTQEPAAGQHRLAGVKLLALPRGATYIVVIGPAGSSAS